MADDGTPTTEDARDDYRRARYYLDDAPEDDEHYRSGGPEFDRWLATHDTEVARAAAEKALREAADAIDWRFEVFEAADGCMSIREHDKTPGQLLTERADRLAEGGEA